MKTETTIKNSASIEAKIFLSVKSNPVLGYLDQTFEIPNGFGWHGCTHSHIHFYKGWAGERQSEINEMFLIGDYVNYDLFCITAGANSGFTQYVLAVKDQHKNIHVATGSKLMNMYWVRSEDTEKILNFIKGFKVSTLCLITERSNPSGGEYRTLRYGWATTVPGTDWDEVQDLKTMNGFPTGLVRLPNHGASDASVIFIRKDKPEHSGWDKLIYALKNMKDGETIQHYAYVPCAGTLVNVKKVGDSYKTWPEHQDEPETVTVELSLCDIFGSVAGGYAVNDNLLPLVREHFIKNSKADLKSAYCEDDYYFGLLHWAGISLAVEVAHENGDTEMEKRLQSWIDAGMTDQESRNVWHNSEKSSCYNHTYYWNSKTVAYETYGLNSPRHKVMCSAS